MMTMMFKFNISSEYGIQSNNYKVLKCNATVDVSAVSYILMHVLPFLQVLVARRVMQSNPLVTLQLLEVRVKLIETVVVFPALLLVLPSPLRNYLDSRVSVTSAL